MKILAIGDPHEYFEYKKSIFKEVDLILLTGDIGKADIWRKMAFDRINREKKGLPEKKESKYVVKKGYMQVYNSSMKVIKYLSKFAPVYLIYGNIEHPNSYVRKLIKKIDYKLPFLSDGLNAINRVKILNNKAVNFDGIRIGGLEYFKDINWVQDFKPSDYDKQMKKARKETNRAKKILGKFGNLDILLCHQPPYGVLDKVEFKGAPKHWLGKHAGSKPILSYIKRKQPPYVLCGHIHEAKGEKKIGKTKVINLGCHGDYKVISI